MKFKGAIFDMDGTVVDSLMFWDDLWQRIGEKYFNNADFRPDEQVDKNIRTMVYTDAMTYFKDYYKIVAPTEEFLSFAENGLTTFYHDVATPKPGAIALLELLKSRGVKLCLASATAMPHIKFALSHFGMLDYFDFVLSCADIGAGKDKPDIYLKAQELLALPASDICVFEDSFVALETAKSVGFKTVGLFDRYNFEQARLKRSSDIYMDENQTLNNLIPLFSE